MLYGNLVGLPAIVFPSAALPLKAETAGLLGSVQAMSRPWADELLLRVALFVESNPTPPR
jgi:Asp-tRNA(Asn)/Glu-tRNA(Gln) amidotransferase A subunit family amidase